MKVQIFEDTHHDELCVVFYMGSQFTLYHALNDRCFHSEMLKTIELGLDNANLNSLDTKSFVNRKKYKYSIEITYE